MAIKGETIFYIGLVSIGAYATYRILNNISKPIEDTGKGISSAVSGIGGGVSNIAGTASGTFEDILSPIRTAATTTSGLIRRAGAELNKLFDNKVTNDFVIPKQNESQADINKFKAVQYYGGNKDFTYEEKTGTLLDKSSGLGYSTATPQKMVNTIKTAVPAVKLYGSAKMVNGKIVL